MTRVYADRTDLDIDGPERVLNATAWTIYGLSLSTESGRFGNGPCSHRGRHSGFVQMSGEAIRVCRSQFRPRLVQESMLPLPVSAAPLPAESFPHISPVSASFPA